MNLEVYTDGSYSTSTPDRVTGGMVILCNGKLLCGQRYISLLEGQVSARNAGGELLAASGGLIVAGTILEKMIDSKEAENTITLYHDYNGVSNFIEGNPTWIPKKYCSVRYVATVNEFKKRYPKVKIKFVKVKSHSGNKWNDVVDDIANGVIPSECKNKMIAEYVQIK